MDLQIIKAEAVPRPRGVANLQLLLFWAWRQGLLDPASNADIFRIPDI